MKRIAGMLLLITVLATMLTGCFGKFSLTRKVYEANSEVSNKFGRSLVTWAFVFVPVYGVSALLDFAIFNTIEFWSGRNPVAQGEKDFEYAQGDDTFKIHAKKQDSTIVYTMDRYEGMRYVDSRVIEWNMVTGVAQPVSGVTGDVAGPGIYPSAIGKTVTGTDPAGLSGLLAVNDI